MILTFKLSYNLSFFNRLLYFKPNSEKNKCFVKWKRYKNYDGGNSQFMSDLYFYHSLQMYVELCLVLYRESVL